MDATKGVCGAGGTIIKNIYTACSGAQSTAIEAIAPPQSGGGLAGAPPPSVAGHQPPKGGAGASMGSIDNGALRGGVDESYDGLYCNNFFFFIKIYHPSGGPSEHCH